MNLMENWIQAYKDQISAVFCQNDEMAMGALNALVQSNMKEKVMVVGIDAIADALKSVKDGELDATVYQDCKGQAEGALDAAYKLVKGESVDKQILIPFILVTKDNVDEYLSK
jgi:ABC-type sugar transport system substrate-binding protein